MSVAEMAARILSMAACNHMTLAQVEHAIAPDRCNGYWAIALRAREMSLARKAFFHLAHGGIHRGPLRDMYAEAESMIRRREIR